jgi:hypothetical protein
LARRSIENHYSSFRAGKGRLARKGLDRFPHAVAYLLRHCTDFESALRTYGDDPMAAPSVRSQVRRALQERLAIDLPDEMATPERVNAELEKIEGRITQFSDEPREMEQLRKDLVSRVLKDLAAMRSDPNALDWFAAQRILARERDQLPASAAETLYRSNDHADDRSSTHRNGSGGSRRRSRRLAGVTGFSRKDIKTRTPSVSARAWRVSCSCGFEHSSFSARSAERHLRNHNGGLHEATVGPAGAVGRGGDRSVSDRRAELMAFVAELRDEDAKLNDRKRHRRQKPQDWRAAGVMYPSNQHPDDRVRLAGEIESVLEPVARAFEAKGHFFNGEVFGIDAASFSAVRLRTLRGLKRTLKLWGPDAIENKAVRRAFEAQPQKWREKVQRSLERERRPYIPPLLPPRSVKGVAKSGRPRMPDAEVSFAAKKKRAYRRGRNDPVVSVPEPVPKLKRSAGRPRKPDKALSDWGHEKRLQRDRARREESTDLHLATLSKIDPNLSD